MNAICPACGYRDQGLSGFCDRCDEERQVERLIERHVVQVSEQRRRRDEWIVERKMKETA